MKSRAGSRWRLLVHDMKGRDGYGCARHIRSHKEPPPGTWNEDDWQRILDARAESIQRGYATYQTIEGTEFDELVVGKWLHVEQMDTGLWWMNVGGVTIHVKADRDGNPQRVTIGDVDDERDGCVYDFGEPVSDTERNPEP